MKTFHNLDDIPSEAQNCILTIGNFDGVHKGHQSLIQSAKKSALEHNKPLVVLTFEPHPRKLLRPDDPPFRITPEALKAERMKEEGVDYLISLSFDWDFASQSAQSFIDTILISAIKPAHILVGSDFCFGQLRKGTPATIQDAGLDITVIDTVSDEGEKAFSSSAIRMALRHGEVDTANNILGWLWEIQGEVVKGDQRGRELGYPTANVHLNDTIHPAYGVYACWVKIDGENKWHMAATNIGIRPMFEVPIGQVEAHILDFDEDIYGKTLRVKPVKRLRGEAKFESLEALISQIEKDCVASRKLLGG